MARCGRKQELGRAADRRTAGLDCMLARSVRATSDAASSPASPSPSLARAPSSVRPSVRLPDRAPPLPAAPPFVVPQDCSHGPHAHRGHGLQVRPLRRTRRSAVPRAPRRRAARPRALCARQVRPEEAVTPCSLSPEARVLAQAIGLTLLLCTLPVPFVASAARPPCGRRRSRPTWVRCSRTCAH